MHREASLRSPASINCHGIPTKPRFGPRRTRITSRTPFVQARHWRVVHSLSDSTHTSLAAKRFTNHRRPQRVTHSRDGIDHIRPRPTGAFFDHDDRPEHVFYLDSHDDDLDNDNDHVEYHSNDSIDHGRHDSPGDDDDDDDDDGTHDDDGSHVDDDDHGT